LALAAAEILELIAARGGLAMPWSPAVAQIVEAKIVDPSFA
jgi:hypothetical protein